MRNVILSFLLLGSVSFGLLPEQNEVVDATTGLTKNQILYQSQKVDSVFYELEERLHQFDREALITVWYQKELANGNKNPDLSIFYRQYTLNVVVDTMPNVEMTVNMYKNQIVIDNMLDQLSTYIYAEDLKEYQILESYSVEYTRAITKGHGW